MVAGHTKGLEQMKLWMNDASDVTSKLSEIRAYQNFPDRFTLAVLEADTQALRDSIVSGELASNRVIWHDYFKITGMTVLALLGDQFDEQKFVEMLLGKHRRYGLKSLVGWRELGVLTRIDQKIARLVNMAGGNPADFGDETQYDTMVDILGYCVIGLYMIEKLGK